MDDDVTPFQVLRRGHPGLVVLYQRHHQAAFGAGHLADRLDELLVHGFPDAGNRYQHLGAFGQQVGAELARRRVHEGQAGRQPAVFVGALVHVPGRQHDDGGFRLFYVDAQARGVGDQVLDEVGMREHDALGVAGGARGVDYSQQIIVGDRGRDAFQEFRVEGDQFLATAHEVGMEAHAGGQRRRQGGGIGGIHHQDGGAAIPVFLFEYLCQGRELIRGFHDEVARIGMPENEGDFLRGSVRPAGHADRADGHEGKVGAYPFIAVVDEKAHVVAPRHAYFRKGCGQCADVGGQARIAALLHPFARFPAVGDPFGKSGGGLEGHGKQGAFHGSLLCIGRSGRAAPVQGSQYEEPSGSRRMNP